MADLTPPPVTLDATQVQMGNANGPGVYVAAAGTDPPTDLTTAWPSAWTSLGYLSEAGPTIAQSKDTAAITPWQSTSPIRNIVTGRDLTVEMVFWQLNEMTLGIYFDSDQPTPDATTGLINLQVRTDAPQHQYAIGIDTTDNDRVLRIMFPRASLSATGNMQIERGAAVPLDCTLLALDNNGTLAYVLLGDVPAPSPVQTPLIGGGQGIQTVSGQAEHRGRRNTPAEAS